MSGSAGKLRVGVVGLGGIAQMMHLPHLAERPDRFEIVRAADIGERTLALVGGRYGIQRLSRDFKEVCADKDVDAVLVLSSGSHREVALCALESGKHLFVEKPLGYGLRESEELVRAASASGRTVMIGYHKRFDPAYRRAREAVRAMKDLRYVEVTVLHPDDDGYRGHHALWPEPDRAAALADEEGSLRRTVQAVTSGPLAGALADVTGADAPVENRVAAKVLCESLIHDINALRGVLGEPDEVVSAHVWRGGMAQTSVTRFGQDVRAHLNWVYLPGLRNYEETVRFIGASSRVTLTFPSPYLRHFPTPLAIERMDGEDHVVEHRTVSYEEAFRAELTHFRECVLTGKRPELPPEEAVGDARWIHAIAAAMR